jgi:hypothetical protein
MMRKHTAISLLVSLAVVGYAQAAHQGIPTYYSLADTTATAEPAISPVWDLKQLSKRVGDLSSPYQNLDKVNPKSVYVQLAQGAKQLATDYPTVAIATSLNQGDNRKDLAAKLDQVERNIQRFQDGYKLNLDSI